RRVALFAAASAVLLLLLHREPLHTPGRILEWWPQLQGRPELRTLRESALYWGAGAFLAMTTGTLLAALEPRRRRASSSHGSAEWGTGDEFRQRRTERRRMRREGGRGNGSLLIGRHRDGSLLWYSGASHLLTMAPTRSGKGVGTVIPNLLTYPGSVLCTDVKGENFAVTHRQRRRLGQEVYALDPFEVTGGGMASGTPGPSCRARFNPLATVATLGPRKSFGRDDAQAISEALILEGTGENRHWIDEARTMVTGFILYVCWMFDADAGDLFTVRMPFGRDLLAVRHLITLPEAELESVLDEMSRCPHPQVARTAALLCQKDPRERSGVISSAQSQTAFLDSPQMASVLADRIGGVPNPLPCADLFRIREAGVRQTVYLVIPPSYLESHAAWLRVVIVCVQGIVTRDTSPPDHRILLLLDEFANLGKIEAVRRGISLTGGYGVAYWLIVQDLSQVDAVYGKGWGTIFANTDVKQLFGTNDLRTAKELSELAGKTTVYTDSGSSGRGADATGLLRRTMNIGETLSEKDRPLLLPDEVLRLDAGYQLLLVRGSGPLIVPRLNYLEMRELEGLHSPNPMY
ncbi:MAG: type IV secretory system conjugative DNA transfer family protein, partial [Gemmatimonadota bacterium]|nr:type IV secretory system conjugative DNA transfer family protein [Gemmatimonadota bacterium]